VDLSGIEPGPKPAYRFRGRLSTSKPSKHGLPTSEDDTNTQINNQNAITSWLYLLVIGLQQITNTHRAQ
jgi:hypothetical protein